jgi:UDP-N-acetylmuramoyl-tripeptide--D-alanyl-D-alanine ligase
MIRPMSLQEVQKTTGGELLGADVLFNSVSIDSRTIKPGELFIAISGVNFNGNNFVADAEKKEAIAAIVSENIKTDLPILKVADTRKALGSIGAMNRKASTACVIALTGSQGKTTVKEMVADILAECGQVLSTKGNQNNDYGVPLSLLGINPEHDFAVIEIGASAPGEVAYCVALTQPQIAHVTNVAATHLEGFGDLAGVAKAKGELWDGIKEGGVAVINIDEDYSKTWCQRAEDKAVITISAKGKQAANYFLSEISLNNDLSTDFVLHAPAGIASIHLELAGIHNSANALAAAALSMEAGASLDNVCSGLEKVKAIPGRLFRKPGLNSSTIIDDSYNASPSSFRAAIDVLVAHSGKTILALGDMGELGDEAQQAHLDIGSYARKKGVDYLFATGRLSELTACSFGEAAEFDSEREVLAQKIIPMLGPGVTVLVKGSRSAGMEQLVELLLGKGD